MYFYVPIFMFNLRYVTGVRVPSPISSRLEVYVGLMALDISYSLINSPLYNQIILTFLCKFSFLTFNFFIKIKTKQALLTLKNRNIII